MRGNQISLAGLLPVKPWLHEKKIRRSQSHKQGGKTYKKEFVWTICKLQSTSGEWKQWALAWGHSCSRAQWTICNTVQWIIFPVGHGWEHPSMVLSSFQQRTSKGSFSWMYGPSFLLSLISILEDLLPHDIYSTVYPANIILQWWQYS